jgi:hypothetical protein
MLLVLLAACIVEAPAPTPAGQDNDDTAPTADTADTADTAPPPAPSLFAVDPALGDVLGGVPLTLQGTDLADTIGVTIGGEACTGLVATPTETTCVAPALPLGTHDVEVQTPGGRATLPGAYEAWSPTEIAGARVYNASAGLTLDAPRGDLWTWETMAAGSPWRPRDGAGLLWFDDRLWLLGGWDGYPVAEWANANTTNEVWVSDDLGATWTQVHADDHAPPSTGPDAFWYPRHTAGMLTHTHEGTPYMYVVGGDIYYVTGDVWRSADGESWERVAAETPWEGRVLQMVGSYDGDLYVMGGQIDINDPSTTLNDVWRSEDGGATWTRLDDAPWAPRGMVYNPVEHDGKLWLIGGGTYSELPRIFYNDVWSFDGSSWTEVSPDGEAPWLAREYHNTYAAEGLLWVSSGYGPDGLNHNDFWYSADGVTWTEAKNAPIAPGHADGVAVTPHGVIHASGNAMDTAVHRMVRGEGAPVSRWADQGRAGLDLRAPVASSTAQVRSEAFGALDGLWFDGVNSYLRLDAWDPLPAGHSVFWVGRTAKTVTWSDYVNPSMTVVGDYQGACRAQAGYSGDQIELVVTDALGAWSEGHVLRGSGQTDDQVRLVGFTHALDGTVTAFINGAQAGDPMPTSYDTAYMGWDLVGAGFYTQSRAEVMLALVVVVPDLVSPDELAKLSQFSRKWGAVPE